MPKIKTRVTVKAATPLTRLKGCTNDALTIMGHQALKDTQPYVPDDQHILKESGINNSSKRAENLCFRLVWAVPYAKYLFNGLVMYGNPTNRTYGPKKISFTAAMAKMEWAKYAQKTHGKEWRRVFDKAAKELARR